MEKQVIWSETGRKNGKDYSHVQEMVVSDGGRSKYFDASNVGDCVTRAIVHATGLDYKVVYDALHSKIKQERMRGIPKHAKHLFKLKPDSPRNGVHKDIYRQYLESLGWTWIPTMEIGSGCKVHLRSDELPKGRLIVRVSKHLVAMIDGVIYDTHDCTRQGTRAVYGYFIKP